MENTSPNGELSLADLISQWQGRRAEGRTVSPAELCRERPELLPELERQIAALERIKAFTEAEQATRTILPQSGEANAVQEVATINLPPNSPELQATPSREALTAPSDSRLRTAERLGQGRHGRRLQGTAKGTQPPRRPEDDSAQLRRRRRTTTLSSRGRGDSAAATLPYHPGVRGRPTQWLAVFVAGVLRGRQLGRQAGRHALGGETSGADGGDAGSRRWRRRIR